MNANSNRIHQAIRRYLELKGYEVLEDEWFHGQDKVDFIALDGECLVFVTAEATMNTGSGIPAVSFERATFERIAAAYITEADIAECEVRFDTVSMLILSEDRGLIRHNVNALGTPLEVG